MSDNNLVSVPIVDKNGKLTSVRKRADEFRGANDKRISAAGAPASLAAEKEQELLAEVSAEVERLGKEIAVYDEQIRAINEKRSPLRQEHLDLIEIKMELQSGRISHESTIEEIQELNRAATTSTAASKDEDRWVNAIHPSIRTMSYNMEHNVPIGQIALDYGFEDSEGLADGLLKLARATADGRDEVEVNILTGGDEYGYELIISVDKGEGRVASSNGSYFYKFGDKDKPLKEVVEWIAKTIPFTYPDKMRESLYPDDGYGSNY